MNWIEIKTDNDLPNEDGEYQCYDAKRDRQFVSYFTKYKNHWGYLASIQDTPTHWQLLLRSPNNKETGIYDLSEIEETEKDKLIRGFVEISAKHTLQLFMSLGLKTHIETMVINDATNEEFIFSFRKVV